MIEADSKKYIETLVQLLSDYDSQNSSLNKKLRDVDQSILDQYHDIELTDYDVVRGYRAYKKLQTTLRNRRDIKDSYSIIIKIEPQMKEITSIVKNTLNHINNREYANRTEDNLFEGDGEKTSEYMIFDTFDDAYNYLKGYDKSTAQIKKSKVKEQVIKAIETGLPYRRHYWFRDSELTFTRCCRVN